MKQDRTLLSTAALVFGVPAAIAIGAASLVVVVARCS
jgi:hypothetical protein